jgi:hypothetical protein
MLDFWLNVRRTETAPKQTRPIAIHQPDYRSRYIADAE